METNKQTEWEVEFDEHYGSNIDAWTLGIVASTLAHQRIKPQSDASYITVKLRTLIESLLKAERERVLEEVGETKKDFLARVLGEFHANNLQGKGYDFYFVLAHELNQLNQLKEQ